MYLKRNFIDLYFLFGLVLFTLGKVYDSVFLNFYLLINILGIFVIFSHFLILKLDFRLSNLGLLLIGFIFYILGNIFFISDVNLGTFNLSDLFFLTQILIKQDFIISSQNFLLNFSKLKLILSLNCLIILICLIISERSNTLFLDIFYFIESFISLIFLMAVNLISPKFFINFKEIDLDFFFIGQLCWLVGDLIYSSFYSLETLRMGDYSDFVFFVGFYFFIKSFNSFRYFYNFNIVKI